MPFARLRMAFLLIGHNKIGTVNKTASEFKPDTTV